VLRFALSACEQIPDGRNVRVQRHDVQAYTSLALTARLSESHLQARARRSMSLSHIRNHATAAPAQAEGNRANLGACLSH
jgi:hypothetical protein